MAAFGAGSARSLPSRGGAVGFRFFLYAILAVVLMFLDQRGSWLESARAYLAAAAYPIQLAVNSPSAAWHWVQSTFEARAALQSENARLRERLRRLELKTMRFDALQRENAELRALKSRLPAVAERWLLAEVVSVELSPLRQRLLINRGANNGVFKGQAVLAAGGLLGQTLRVGPWSSEIILATDPEHALPVQVLRNGLRTIAVGSGSARLLTLPYLPVSSDVVVGDVLVTSGLGGIFPQGYPVAEVKEVRRDAAQSLAVVSAEPLARIDREREVLLVWFRAGHPAAPWAEAPAGDPSLAAQPQPAPRPASKPPAAAPPSPAAVAPSQDAPPGGAAAAAASPAAGAPATTRPPPAPPPPPQPQPQPRPRLQPQPLEERE